MKKYTADDIAALFPALSQITDAGLRDRVAAVWNEALATGRGGRGWSFDELRAIPFAIAAGDIDLTFVEHLNSCSRQCIAIAQALDESFGGRVPINLDYLIAGSLLADCGKLLEFDVDPRTGRLVRAPLGELLRHPFSGVALCWKHGIPAEVMHIVATHSHEGDQAQRSIESIIFHHADFVDFDIAKYLGALAAKAEK
jgi:hypothetical protein